MNRRQRARLVRAWATARAAAAQAVRDGDVDGYIRAMVAMYHVESVMEAVGL